MPEVTSVLLEQSSLSLSCLLDNIQCLCTPKTKKKPIEVHPEWNLPQEFARWRHLSAWPFAPSGAYRWAAIPPLWPRGITYGTNCTHLSYFSVCSPPECPRCRRSKDKYSYTHPALGVHSAKARLRVVLPVCRALCEEWEALLVPAQLRQQTFEYNDNSRSVCWSEGQKASRFSSSSIT